MTLFKPALACAAIVALGGATAANAADLIPIPEPLPPIEVQSPSGGMVPRGRHGGEVEPESPTGLPAESAPRRRRSGGRARSPPVRTSRPRASSASAAGYRFQFLAARRRHRRNIAGGSQHDGLRPGAAGIGPPASKPDERDPLRQSPRSSVWSTANIDLGTWWGVTPFVGARRRYRPRDDRQLPRTSGTIFPSNVSGFSNSVTYADSKSQMNFAWLCMPASAMKSRRILSLLEIGYAVPVHGRWPQPARTYRFDGVQQRPRRVGDQTTSTRK